MSKYNGEHKFNWKAGDIKFDLPQCAYCAYNLGPFVCKVYGIKPEQYMYNTEKCPDRKADEL